jgi:hypothetical protein
MILFLLICAFLLVRNELVWHWYMKAWALEDEHFPLLHANEQYLRSLIDLRKWTFAQFFPHLKEYQ